MRHDKIMLQSKGGLLPTKLFRQVFVALLLVQLFFVFPVLAASETPILFSKGVVAFSDGDYKKALSLFQKSYKADPSDNDNLYFLAVTHLKLNDPSQASKHFKILLGRNPDYAKAYFDYALTLYRMKKYPESMPWLEKSVQSDPKNPLPLFYTGLVQYKTGNEEGSLEAFKQVVKRFPQSETASTAKEWVSKLEGEETSMAPSEEKEKLQRLDLRAATFAFYDSNLILDPDNENVAGSQTKRKDLFAGGALDVQYRFYKTQKATFSVDYSGYQNGYANLTSDVGRFNFGRHIGGVNYQYKISKHVQWRFPLHYAFYTLGAAKYLQSGIAAMAFDFAWKNNWLTTLLGTLRRDDFYTAPANSAQGRDAFNTTGGFEQYFFFPQNKKMFLKGGYSYGANLAKGNDWDYREHRVVFSFNAPLSKKWNFLVLSDMAPLRAFRHVDSVFSVKRHDFTFNGTGVLSLDVSDHFTGSLSYTYAMSDSNIERFTYRRHLAGFTLTAKL